MLSEAIDMQLNSFTNQPLDPSQRFARGHTTGQVRHISAIPSPGLFVNDCIFHFRLSPACLRTLFKVPRGISSEGCPATVTVPGFLECLYWRWLPRVLSRYQPSSSMNLMTSRTFMTPSTSLQHRRHHFLRRLHVQGALQGACPGVLQSRHCRRNHRPAVNHDFDFLRDSFAQHVCSNAVF